MGSAANARELRAFATYAAEKIGEDDNYALRGVLVRYLTPGRGDVSHVEASVADLPLAVVNGIWLVGLFGLGLAALAAVWRDNHDPVVRLLEFSIVLTGIVLASPHTQRRYFVALYVPAVALVALLVRRPAPPDKRSILIGLLAIAASATILPLLFAGRRLALLYEARSPYFFGTLILFGVLVMMTVASKGRPRDADVGWTGGSIYDACHVVTATTHMSVTPRHVISPCPRGYRSQSARSHLPDDAAHPRCAPSASPVRRLARFR